MGEEMCGECKFYYTPSSGCRRFPPQLRHDGEFRFPVMGEADWCGEFRPATPAQE
jgi:hypothetical protein